MISKKRYKNSITAIIITKDRPLYLQNAVNSVKNQSCKVNEIIIVDNGSNIKKYKYSKVKYIKTNYAIGASLARNIGAANSNSEFLAFLDDDDVWDKNYIKNSKKYFSKNFILIGKIHSKFNKKIIENKSKNFNDINSSLKNLYIKNPGIIGSNIIIPKTIFNDVKGFDKNLPLGQDKGLAIEAKKKGYKLIRTDAKVYFDENTEGVRNTSLVNYFKGKIKFFAKYKNEMSLITKLLFFKFSFQNIFYIIYKKI